MFAVSSSVLSSTSASSYFVPYLLPLFSAEIVYRFSCYCTLFQQQWYIVVGFANGIAISLLPPILCIYRSLNTILYR